MRNREVGLETHRTLDSKRVGNLSISFAGGGREGLIALEEDLEEDLGVESEWGGIERNGLTVVDQSIRAGNGVRDEEVDEVSRGEAGVTHAGEDLVNIVLGLGDEAKGGGDSRVRAAREELKTGSTRAVRDCDGTSELNEITSGDVERLEEGLQVVDGVVDTVVGG